MGTLLIQSKKYMKMHFPNYVAGKDEGSMKHPTDDILLAYVRQQQCHLWPQGIQEHVALCPICSVRCAEFRSVSNTIETWAQSPADDTAYATVSNRVMRKLYEPEPFLSNSRPDISRSRLGMPIAVMLVVLCFVLLAGLGINIAGNVAQSSKAQPTPKVVLPNPTAIQNKPTATPVEPIITPVPAGPIATGVSSPTVTSTPQGGPHIETNAPCTTEIDVIQGSLHVCGTNFTPGTTVTIHYQIGTKHKKHVAQISAAGTFTDTLSIRECRDVPTAIYVQSTTNPSETAQIEKNIQFGTCQVFGN